MGLRQAMRLGSLYLHIPFCQVRCAYCDFNTYVGIDHLRPRYVEALTREIASADSALEGPLETIYFGGGTPSLLSHDQVAAILHAATSRFGIVAGAEISVEANPGTVTYESLCQSQALGVNRISFGFQSFDDQLLQRLGRDHSAHQAVESYLLAREAGFENINIDLIYGLPGQSLEQWAMDVERAIAMEPDHISLYALTIEERTLFGRLAAQGHLKAGDDDLMAEEYLLATEQLARVGYDHYEVSNWAKPGRRCRHNLTYWWNGFYLGCGAGAHSHLPGRRFFDVLNPFVYVRRVMAAISAIGGEEAVDEEREAEDALILGLRLKEGMDLAEFTHRFGWDPRRRYAEEISELEAAGLLAMQDGAIVIPERGWLLANEVFTRLLAARSSAR